MNILRVIGSMDPSSGGPCQGIRYSIPELEKQGVHNEVVCFDDPAASFLGKDAFPIYALGPGKGPWNYSASLKPWLMENFSRFDAVMVHGLWLYHSYAVKKALNQFMKQQRAQKLANNKIPKLFIMPHGMLDPYFQKTSGRKLKAIRNWLYWKLIEGNVVNEADGVLFTCEAELLLAREPFRPYHPKREINVGYGIAEPPAFTLDMRNAFLEKCPEVQNQPYILFLSRIHEKKGLDLLINAYAEIASKVRKAKVDIFSVASIPGGEVIAPEFVNTQLPALVIAGPGLDTAYGQHIQQLIAKSYELKTCIHLPGMLTGAAKWGAFYGCESFILPSHQENFGIAVVEALACGKPVLISDQVNIWREIQASGSGMISLDTLEGIIELLKRWLKLSKEEKQVLGRNAQELYSKYFAVGPAAKKMVSAIV